LFVDFLAELVSRETRVLLYPSIGFYNLIGISGACQDLCDQGIRIERDRRYQLLEFRRSLLRGLNRHLLSWLIALIGKRRRRRGKQEAE
jgi:hypothetical protein